jgi:hypothetical protein
MHRFVITFSFALLLALAGRAITHTPDQQPPAQEAPCDGLTGAAFGICNAYCEAQDCDVHDRPSCKRLRAKLLKVTGSELFPCDPRPCIAAEFPACDGDCPPGSVCLSGADRFEGPVSGGPDSQLFCACRVLCESSEAPTCGGLCPGGLVCVPGPENGGSDATAIGCSCRVPCGLAEAPACNGVCPSDLPCLSGPDDGGPDDGGPDFGGADQGSVAGCFCGDIAP